MVEKNKYKLKQKGILLEDLDLQNDLESDLKERGYLTIDKLFGAMLGSKEIFQDYFQQFHQSYDEIINQIEGMLPPDRIKEITANPAPVYSLGMLPDDSIKSK